MSFSINTNLNAMAAVQALSLTQSQLAKTQNAITTGYKVGSAADDASTFSIAQGMRANVAGLQAVGASLAMGQSIVGVSSAATDSISTVLQDLAAKVTQAQSPGSNLANLQSGVAADLKQIDSYAKSATFNNVNLLNGGTYTTSTLNMIASADGSLTVNISGQNLTSKGLSINAIDVSASNAGISSSKAVAVTATGTWSFSSGDTFSVVSGPTGATVTQVFQFTSTGTATGTNIAVQMGATNEQDLSNLVQVMQSHGVAAAVDANDSLSVAGSTLVSSNTSYGAAAAGSSAQNMSLALASVNVAISSVSTYSAQLGTAANALTNQSNFVKSLTDQLNTGISNLVDADMTQESAQLQALQTRQQLGIQALSIANQQPSAVLSLFR